MSTLADLADHLPDLVVAATGEPGNFAGTVNRDGTLHLVANGNEIDIGVDNGQGELDAFNANLAEDMDDVALSAIAAQLIREIEQDDRQRSEWLKTRQMGIDLLGLRIEEPRGDVGSTTAPLEGMSTYRAPDLLKATLRSQALARGELLPPGGPIKVVDDSTVPGAARDERAETLERCLNIYLTQVCPEYYPDTDTLIFWTVFGGAGFKKGYHCPLRRRPVLESIDAEDIIVSPGAADLRSARRVTHRIRMKESDVRRLMASGHFRRSMLSAPPPNPEPDSSFNRRAEVMGLDPRAQVSEDQPRILYEANCEWVFPDDPFRPEALPEDIPLPYRITIDKASLTVLSIRRRWGREDPMAVGLLDIIRYPYIEGMGIYGLGLVHLLGNTDRAITAATREMLDSGMFANFPGFIYDDRLARQLNNEFRVPPGGGVKVQSGGTDLRQLLVPLPYKDVTPGLISLIQHVEKRSDELAGMAELPTGEGRGDLPVGTIIALIDQATKPIDAIHRRLHTAQAEEFQLLKRLLREDPEALWRSDKMREEWDRENLLQALEDYDLVPVADPNMPTHTHRLLKAAVLKQMQMMTPMQYDSRVVDAHVLRMLGFSQPEHFFAGPMSPEMMASMNPMADAAKAQQMQAQVRMAATQARAQSDRARTGAEMMRAAAEAKTDEMKIRGEQALEEKRIELERLKIQAETDTKRQKTGADLIQAAAALVPEPEERNPDHGTS